MPVFDPEENKNALIDAIPGLREQLEEEADRLFASPGPLTTDQQQRLQSLARRRERLQPVEPIEFGQVGSNRIPGNPFTFDTRGAAKGISDLAFGIVNRIRANRRRDVEGELLPLAQQQRAAQEADELKRDFQIGGLNRLGPTVLSQEGQNERQRVKIKAEAVAAKTKFGQSKKLKRLDNKLKIALEKFKNSGSGSTGGQRSTGLTTGLANRIENAANARDAEANRLLDIKSRDFFDPDAFEGIDDDIKTLRDEANQLRQLAAQPFRSDADFDSVVDSLDAIIGGETAPGGDDDTTVTPQELSDFAEQNTGGDVDAARRILLNRGLEIQEIR